MNQFWEIVELKWMRKDMRFHGEIFQFWLIEIWIRLRFGWNNPFEHRIQKIIEILRSNFEKSMKIDEKCGGA